MMRDETDAEVIAASRDDPACFALIFDRHFDAVHRYVQRRIGADLADDVVAETFAVAFRCRSAYDTRRADARPWLLGIATNILRHEWRRERLQLRAFARTGIDPVTRSLAEADAVEERVDAQAVARRVALALTKLRRAERDVLLLYAWGDLSYAELADALGIPVGTVRSRLSRARHRVRELLRGSGQSSVEAAKGDEDG
jgi:RNA polymerase sigma factor (sigma-70 family)